MPSGAFGLLVVVVVAVLVIAALGLLVFRPRRLIALRVWGGALLLIGASFLVSWAVAVMASKPADHKHFLGVPTWAAIGFIAAGVILLVIGEETKPKEGPAVAPPEPYKKTTIREDAHGRTTETEEFRRERKEERLLRDAVAVSDNLIAELNPEQGPTGPLPPGVKGPDLAQWPVSVREGSAYDPEQVWHAGPWPEPGHSYAMPKILRNAEPADPRWPTQRWSPRGDGRNYWVPTDCAPEELIFWPASERDVQDYKQPETRVRRGQEPFAIYDGPVHVLTVEKFGDDGFAITERRWGADIFVQIKCVPGEDSIDDVDPGIALFQLELAAVVTVGRTLLASAESAGPDDFDVWRREYDEWCRATFVWLRDFHPPMQLVFESGAMAPMAGPDPRDRAEFHGRQMRQLQVRIANVETLIERM